MKQFILRAVVALFVLCGVLIVTQTCFADASNHSQYASQPAQSVQPVQKTAHVNPPVGTQVMSHPVTPTQVRTGLTRQEIRSLPIVARPSRPGHFIGNTVRRRAGVGY